MEIIAKKMHFVLFINTKSGNADGKSFFKLGYPELVIRYEDLTEGHLYFIDLFDASSKLQGIELVKKFILSNIQFRVIICGGDGTIPWVLTEILNQGLSLTRIIFGIIPIGTGNDFSRSIGWGTNTVKISRKNLADISRLVKQWMNAIVGFYDMWDITVQTYDNGKIFDIKNQEQIEWSQKSFKKMFTNYVGLGLDARVVYTVQRHRTNYAFLNKVVYGLIGLSNFFKSMVKIDEKVESITEKSDQWCFQEQNTVPLLQNDQKMTMKVDKSQFPVKPGRCGIVFLNCTSYMAGLRKVWQTKKIGNINIQKQRASEYFKEQTVDDGMIQLVSYKNQLNLALERVIRSGEKILQGKGPFAIKMKVPNGEEVTHMQINGQSIKVINLKSVLIRKTQYITDHKLRVMIKNQNS